MVNIDTKLYSEIKDYCKINNLKIGEYINNLLQKAFIEDKYGKTPFDNKEENVLLPLKENVPNEAIVEKIPENIEPEPEIEEKQEEKAPEIIKEVPEKRRRRL